MLLRWKPYTLLLMICLIVGSVSQGQDKQIIQVKTFDEKLVFLQHISLLLNDKIEVTTNEKGLAFTEVSANEIPFRSIHVKNEGLEVASWNLSKGTVEIIVRKKNYNIVTVTVLDQGQDPLARIDVTFTGSRKINVKTAVNGTLQLPLGLDERITSPNQFFIKGYQALRLSAAAEGYTLIVEKLVPAEAQKQGKPAEPVKRLFSAQLSVLDTVRSLREFYLIVRDLPMNELDDAQKARIDKKFNVLLRDIQVTDSLADAPVISITDSLAITDDIRRLIERAMVERSQLETQRSEFDVRIEALDKKLTGGIANLEPATREQLLKDIVSLENLLIDNKRQFDKNQADYQLIINSIKERYFNIKILEEKLTVSELLREQEQKEFRQQVILASIALVIFLILIILLARFSNKMRKQQKALTQANNEIRKINESLEERVATRTKLLQETNIELDTFLYRASHDLRTPIASIEGIASLVNHLSHEEFIGMIKTSTEKMNNLLRNLSIISEINQPTHRAQNVQVNALLKAVAADFSSELFSHQVKATWQCPESITMNTYPILLEAIIGKLVENAIFFSAVRKDVSPEIQVRITRQDTGIVLIVEDNGVGISESIRPRVTEMFFRGYEKSKGSGLGLYMVSRCLRLMKGTMAIESEEGRYTRIIVQLPDLPVNK